RAALSAACPGRERHASPSSKAKRRGTQLQPMYPYNGGAWRPYCARALHMTGRPILTVEAMRAAEQRAVEAGVSIEQLMERAGAGLAEAAYRFAGPMPTLVLCGPGNNGGDGYVAARILAARGGDVRGGALDD